MNPPRFAALTLDAFRARVTSFLWTRRVVAVHFHHTWSPTKREWRGDASVQAMWRYHTQTNGWSDIAQHVTIAPDGLVWLGRDWNRAPASSTGFNGTGAEGPFMFETVGNFDAGHETLDGAQRVSVLAVIAAVQARFRLPASSLRFHRQLNNNKKTCPGSGIPYDPFVAELTAFRASIGCP